MLNSNVSDIYKALINCSSSGDVPKTCSLYGLYQAKGGKQNFKPITQSGDKTLKVFAFSYKMYYSILFDLMKKNRSKKTKNIETRTLVKEFYDSDLALCYARNFGHMYERGIKIDSNFCGNDIVTLIILSTVTAVEGGKVTKSGCKPINVTNNLDSQSLLHDLALNHAVAMCNMIMPNSVNAQAFNKHIVFS